MAVFFLVDIVTELIRSGLEASLIFSEYEFENLSGNRSEGSQVRLPGNLINERYSREPWILNHENERPYLHLKHSSLTEIFITCRVTQNKMVRLQSHVVSP